MKQKQILKEFEELKAIPMTDEYAAHHWFQQGWMACRLAYMLHDKADEAGAFRV
jgi:hypothetical protein